MARSGGSHRKGAARAAAGGRPEPVHVGQWPFDRYAAHSHDYDKVIYVVSGAITFGLPHQGRVAQLNAGDRLELPAAQCMTRSWASRE